MDEERDFALAPMESQRRTYTAAMPQPTMNAEPYEWCAAVYCACQEAAPYWWELRAWMPPSQDEAPRAEVTPVFDAVPRVIARAATKQPPAQP
jgi:hypothetical protein